jgi:hypothetical protein
MSEKAALLKRAEILRQEGRCDAALVWYEKYFHREPGDRETRKQWIDCLYLEAIAKSDDAHFKQANQALMEYLEKDWDWQRGHQLRIDLFYHSGKLDILKKDYEQLQQQDKSREGKCKDIIRIIELMEKFKQSPIVVQTELPNEENFRTWFGSFWPLLTGVPILLWVAYEICTFPFSTDQDNFIVVFMVMMILCLAVLGLFFFSMKLRQKNTDENKTKRDKDFV